MNSSRVDPAFDVTKPSVARVYDYYLGGKNNFAADRELAGTVINSTNGMVRDVARSNRLFLLRALTMCVSAGAPQVLDIGTGIPTIGGLPNVFDAARAAHRDARVVGVDNDPVVLSHDRTQPGAGAGYQVLAGDVREPGEILDHPVLRAHLDLSRPITLLLVALLHFVRDDDTVSHILDTLREALAPGSYLVISHATADGVDTSAVADTAAAYEATDCKITFRSVEQITTMFDGWDLLEPGVVDLVDWRPDGSVLEFRPALVRGLCGVGRLR